MFKGAGVAIITPFKDDQIDLPAFERLIDFQIQNDIQALIVLGTTGEASTQTWEERETVIKAAVAKTNKKVPVIVGTGSNNTEVAIKYTKQAEALGADGVLVVTPYYNKCTQKGLIQHYTEIARATSLPVILYNVPSRTGVNIEPQTVVELAKVQNIIGVKEASANMGQILEIKRLVPESFKIWSGNDDNILPIYSCGGDGVISVLANVVPKETQAMCKAFEEGNIKEAIRLQVYYKKLINLLFVEVNPIPTKAALSAMGYAENQLRLPLTPMEEENMKKLVEEMKYLQII
ncbi:4-hydroxy-tetrahydrodipicolinate synthase [Clostridium formicaceticum]|uniref:4-hydroxy-tetrahydrodipicolinate synthase n=1 Tax=Clostridium formicaceticum TaxID=1497 RepID=A0AAC9WFG2_9CLOT|nr:4-hydroxy-tetrahydrodipicolinate synthase [Clostridium formicaceticum]AOY76297.1 4-hydroxy-tetrahydrodipicolinate synthase [Clostridium formicaceticum]ARE86684.1 4-hydroxy-tetrahydrodipicolinate synthase [Clostridium formicaceticum]